MANKFRVVYDRKGNAHWNGHAREVRFADAVNAAIDAGKSFYFYRSVDGKVEKTEIFEMTVSNDGFLQIVYLLETDNDTHYRNATETDLKLIGQQAQTYKKAA